MKPLKNVYPIKTKNFEPSYPICTKNLINYLILKSKFFSLFPTRKKNKYYNLYFKIKYDLLKNLNIHQNFYYLNSIILLFHDIFVKIFLGLIHHRIIKNLKFLFSY